METTQRVCGRAFFTVAFFVFTALLHAGELIHVVANGETAYSMARQYGVKVEDILLLNGIDDARRIRVGQKIRIPQGSLMAPQLKADNEKPRTHYTEKGETLTGIARKYAISLTELRELNALPLNYVLKAGDVLVISAPQETSAGASKEKPTAQPAKKAPYVPPKTESKNKATIWPFTAKEQTYISGKLSPGMLLTGEPNESVRSVSSGTVVSAGPYRGYGRVVIVKSDSGYDYFYGGCETLSVRKGDRVVPGTEVGRLGVSAHTAKPQLTFMIYLNRTSLDPATAPRA